MTNGARSKPPTVVGRSRVFIRHSSFVIPQQGYAMLGRDRPPGPTDYLFDWITWLQGEEQEQFAVEFARVRASGSAAELTDLMVSWHNRAMQRQARRRRLEREDEGDWG